MADRRQAEQQQEKAQDECENGRRYREQHRTTETALRAWDLLSRGEESGRCCRGH